MKSISSEIDLKIQEIEERGWAVIHDLQNENQLEMVLHAMGQYFKVDLGKKAILEAKLFSTIAKRTLSGEYGYGAFPFHSDGANLLVPPRFISLRYLGEKNSRSSTLLLDGNTFKDALGENSPTLNEIYLVKGDPNNFYTSILGKLSPKLSIIRYNPMIMKKVSKSRSDSFEDVVLNLKPVQIRWKAGMAVLIDNWRMLHARELVPNSEVQTRKIERIFLNKL